MTERITTPGVPKKSSRTSTKFPAVYPETGLAAGRLDREPLPLALMMFVMRAFKTTVPTGHIYWATINEPDAAAALAPYAPGDLADVVVAGVYDASLV